MANFSNSRFIKFIPCDESSYLREHHPNAFLLLSLIAERARRISGHPDGLQIAEAFIGDYKKAGIETRDKYRTAIEVLEKRKHIEKVETCRNRKKCPTGSPTIGTKVRLLKSSIWDINSNDSPHQLPHRIPTGSPPDPHEEERIRKNKKEKEVSEVENPHTRENFSFEKVIGLDFSISENEEKVFEPFYPIKSEEQSINTNPVPKIDFRKNVHLSQTEYDELLAKHGKESLEWMLNKLSFYKSAKNVKYHCDYSTIMNWVVDSFNEHKAKNVNSKSVDQSEENRLYANSRKKNFFSETYRIDLTPKGIEFIPLTGQLTPDFVDFTANGFQDQVNNLLRNRKFKEKKIS